MRVSVDDIVQDFQSQMRHANLIGIRKTKGNPEINRRFVLDDAVQLTADIPCGLLHL